MREKERPKNKNNCRMTQVLSYDDDDDDDDGQSVNCKESITIIS